MAHYTQTKMKSFATHKIPIPKKKKIENTNIMYPKNLHKHKKKLAKHKYTMFWNFKSPKNDLRS